MKVILNHKDYDVEMLFIIRNGLNYIDMIYPFFDRFYSDTILMGNSDYIHYGERSRIIVKYHDIKPNFEFSHYISDSAVDKAIEAFKKSIEKNA